MRTRQKELQIIKDEKFGYVRFFFGGAPSTTTTIAAPGHACPDQSVTTCCIHFSDSRPGDGRRQRTCSSKRHALASREKGVLSQWEMGAGLVLGGGPMARLRRLIGRGRALEVLLGADDVSGDLEELYGYVILPDSELDGFVDSFCQVRRFT